VNSLGEKILKNSDVCEQLGVSDYERKQLIAAGILDAPVETGAKYPRHTLSQVVRAKERIIERSKPAPRIPSGGRRTKPLSRKMISEIRGSR
jgi:hypothetical protein